MMTWAELLLYMLTGVGGVGIVGGIYYCCSGTTGQRQSKKQEKKITSKKDIKEKKSTSQVGVTKQNKRTKKEEDQTEDLASQNLDTIPEYAQIPDDYQEIGRDIQYEFEGRQYDIGDNQGNPGECLWQILFPYLNTQTINQALVDKGRPQGVRELLNDAIQQNHGNHWVHIDELQGIINYINHELGAAGIEQQIAYGAVEIIYNHRTGELGIPPPTLPAYARRIGANNDDLQLALLGDHHGGYTTGNGGAHWVEAQGTATLNIEGQQRQGDWNKSSQDFKLQKRQIQAKKGELPSAPSEKKAREKKPIEMKLPSKKKLSIEILTPSKKSNCPIKETGKVQRKDFIEFINRLHAINYVCAKIEFKDKATPILFFVRENNIAVFDFKTGTIVRKFPDFVWENILSIKFLSTVECEGEFAIRWRLPIRQLVGVYIYTKDSSIFVDLIQNIPRNFDTELIIFNFLDRKIIKPNELLKNFSEVILYTEAEYVEKKSIKISAPQFPPDENSETITVLLYKPFKSQILDKMELVTRNPQIKVNIMYEGKLLPTIDHITALPNNSEIIVLIEINKKTDNIQLVNVSYKTLVQIAVPTLDTMPILIFFGVNGSGLRNEIADFLSCYLDEVIISSTAKGISKYEISDVDVNGANEALKIAGWSHDINGLIRIGRFDKTSHDFSWQGKPFAGSSEYDFNSYYSRQSGRRWLESKFGTWAIASHEGIKKTGSSAIARLVLKDIPELQSKTFTGYAIAIAGKNLGMVCLVISPGNNVWLVKSKKSGKWIIFDGGPRS